ncbi:MAG: YhbY family RNA-binding protein, partial [Oscillospiraceae bacterium]|nr:YhbY family RNA-binding protein [Oscillospiraceae bacterium]
MLTSKERAALRAQANGLDTTLMVGKMGVTDAVVAEAENLLNARELVKGKVLEGALLSPREVCDALCEATGAEGIAVIGTKFVIYRYSEKCQQERNQTG